MEALKIEAQHISPFVHLSEEKRTIEITGTSMMEDASIFYEEIKNWVSEYIKTLPKETHINCKFSYFNISTTKQLLRLFYMFEDNNLTDKTTVDWFYDSNDELIKERGEELQKMVNLPFAFHQL